MLKEYPGDTR